ADVEVQIQVAAPFTSTDHVRCVEVAAVDVASGMLHGPYEGITAVMADLGRWVAERGFRLDGPMVNLYVVGPEQEQDPTRWVTEVCLPVVQMVDAVTADPGEGGAR
ncbi:MAG: GyrI-like domain-containing protein, partial [Cellulomonadaceae bacterium]|nr:GyrI-like domain-containing protein [Cellulomonadaceae bacterium]